MSRNRGTQSKFKFKGFVNLEFSLEEREAIKMWIEEFEEPGAASAAVLVEGGFKIGLSWDDFHSAYQIAATCRLEGSKYYGYCFTLKHADIERGLLVMRHFYDKALQTEHYNLDDPVSGLDW